MNIQQRRYPGCEQNGNKKPMCGANNDLKKSQKRYLTSRKTAEEMQAREGRRPTGKS